MYLEIFVVLIIALAAFSHYRSGIWSAVLTLWAALLAGAIAFGFYLSLARAIFPVADPLGESTAYYWGDGLMLLVLFVVSFAVLRILAEQLLRNSMTFAALIDGVVGAVIGAAAGLIMAGILAVFAQMMPLPAESVLGYAPFTLPDGERSGRMITRADDIVLGLYNAVLGGSLSGGRGNLASHYPPAEAPRAARSGDDQVGSTADDILYYYFRRRVEYAIAVNDTLGPFKETKRKGVLVEEGHSGTYSPGRGVPGAVIKIAGARMVPYAAWAANLKPAATTDGDTNLQWTNPDGTPVKFTGRDAANYAVLLIQVDFRPETEDPYSLSLSDWGLDTDLKAGGKKEAMFPKPKLWGTGKKQDEGQEPVVMPTEAVGTEKRPAILDATSVEVEAWRPAQGRKDDADAWFVSDAAVWNFAGGSRQARATLAFLVPSLSMPRHYGINCGGAAVAGEVEAKHKEPLARGRREDVGPFQIRILNVEWRPSAAPFQKETPKGYELAMVTVELSKKAGEPILLKASNLQLQNLTLNQDYQARLWEHFETKEGKTEIDRTVRYADIRAENPEVVTAEDGAKGQQLADSWEVYFENRAGRVTLPLMFEIPVGRRSDRYGFQVAEDLASEAPEWYLLRNVEAIGSRTHLVTLEDTESADSISILLPDGRVWEQGVGQSGGQEILVAIISLLPKNAEDKAYYELKVDEVALRATKGPRAGRDIQMFGFRLEGQKAFTRYMPNQSQSLVFQGEKETEFAYFVTKEREDLELKIKGFKDMELSTGSGD